MAPLKRKSPLQCITEVSDTLFKDQGKNGRSKVACPSTFKVFLILENPLSALKNMSHKERKWKGT